MTKRMNYHFQTYELIPEEQKGGVSEKQGTIDQLLTDNMILDHAKKNKRHLSTAWIDYRKAFDSVPHDWLLKSLEIHKFPVKLTNFYSSLMKKWQTSLHISTPNETISTGNIDIKNGIFQGDCSSGLHFILCLLPLSWLIKRSRIGYSIGRRNERYIISHLLFMDDIKLYANNISQLRNLLETVSMFSNDIKMSFGLDKCNILNITKGTPTLSENITLASEETIRALDLREQYKYLGMLQSNEINKKRMKEKYREEYFNRVKKVLKTSLNSRNTIQAINTYAVSSISYGFQVLDWSVTELEDIDRQTRNVLRKHHMLHNNSDTDRMYVSRPNGGRGLLNITDLYKTQMIAYSEYLKQSTERLMLLVSTLQQERGSKSIHHKANMYLAELGIDQEQHQYNKQQLKKMVKSKRTTIRIDTIREKKLHGQFLVNVNEPHIDKNASLAWLKSSTLKRATESTICAIQENAISTNYIKKHIHKTSDDDMCRACRQHKETIQHVISGCPTLAPTKYIERHDNVCKYIHLLLANKYNLMEEIPKWYEYDPEPLLENDSAKVLWNFPVQTDRRVNHNKPDILVLEKVERKIYIIDIAVPNDVNISRKRNEKINKYANLAIEIKQLWNAQTVKTVPIIIGATGLIHERFQTTIKEKLNIDVDCREIQKIVLLGTANISRYFFSTDY